MKLFESRKNILMMVLGVLLIASIAYNTVSSNENEQLREKVDKEVLKQDSILSTKLILQKELDEAQASLGKYKGRNAELDSMLEAASKELARRQENITRLTKANAGLQAMKKELASLRKLRLQCDERVAALLQEKEGLRTQLAAANNTNQLLQAANNDLSKKLEWAKQLNAQLTGVKYYKLKKGNAKETAKINKAGRVVVSVDIKENPLADAGTRTLYLVVKGPDGKVIGSGKTFFNDKTQANTAYSAMKQVEYNKEAMAVKLQYDFARKPAKGSYKFEVYIDGKYAGKTEMALAEGLAGYNS